MKVLLINPPAENLVQTFAPDSITEEMGYYSPMGLLYIASYANAKYAGRFQIEILDTQVEQMGYDRIKEHIKKTRPDVVGISSMTFLVIDSLKVAKLAKEVDPNIHVVVGGTHPSIFPQEMAAQPEIDSIVIGEGEITFSELLDALDKKLPLDGIRGVGYRKNGCVIINPGRDFIRDLDSLPFPDRNLIPYKKYYNLLGKGKEVMTSMLTSRGCPHNCIFCTKKDGRICRMRSPENVLREIEECLALGINDFDIIDDTFTINRKRIMSITNLIIEKDLKITMDVRARVDQVDQEILDKLARAGCNRIRFGVESGNSEVLKNLKKGIRLDQVHSAFKMAKKAGIVTFAYFMLGSPGETASGIEESISLAKKINPDYVQFLITTPFPATELYDLGMEKGILTNDYWREFSAQPTEDFVPQWWTENFSHEELEKLQRKAHLSFYYRPSYILKQFLKVRSIKELARKAHAGFRLFKG
ncbi:MAG: radical SAM protein [Candidatus Aminicenantes bacterium]|nr:radical SAM protein [Candidatus Aminicenantes bacterium]